MIWFSDFSCSINFCWSSNF